MRAADLLTILTKSPKKQIIKVFFGSRPKTDSCDKNPDK